MNGLVFSIVVISVALWLLLLASRRRPHSAGLYQKHVSKHGPAGKEAAGRVKFPGVSVNAAPRSCLAAQLTDGARFHPDDAPALPLPGCTEKHCKCTYVHHSDRRSGTLDRRRLSGLKQDYLLFFGREDHREGRGRRASDWAAAYKNSDYLTY
jgi:hypothetical protein